MNSILNSLKMGKESHWYFSAEQLTNSPSRKHGIDNDVELSYRQMTAYLIQEMGQRLQVSQLCINTAIVYMHRFYAFHSFTQFHRNGIAAASLFLAAKVEEQPRKLEHVIKAANKCLNQPTSGMADAYYVDQAQDLVFNENVLLQTLGFDVAIDHPHTHVVKTCQLVKACKDLAQTSYFLASNSLHLTSMCLQYKPTVVACFCIYLACKWSRWEIPQSTEGKHWFHYVDKSVTMELLKQLTDEFIAIYEKSPARLKSKLNSIKALAQGAGSRGVGKDKRAGQDDWKMGDIMKMYHPPTTNDTNNVNSLTQNSGPAPPITDMSSGPALLPPPPPQQRKSDMHSSQHRAHHGPSHQHHTKIPYNSSNDVPDHKSGHKQPQLGGTLLGRSREHMPPVQGHQPMMPSSSSSSIRSNLLSNARSTLTTGMPNSSSQRQSSANQNHPIDVNYHKSRDRVNIQNVSNHGGPSVHLAQKSSQKHDTSRVMSKDMNTCRIQDQPNKQGNKMFPPKSMGAQQQYEDNQLASKLMNSKIDFMMFPNRNNVMQSGSSGNYHQSQMARQSGGTGSGKQQSSISVSMQQQQQQQQQQQNNKQPLPITDQQFNMGMQDSQQTGISHLQQPLMQSGGYSNMRMPDMMLTDELNSKSQFSLMNQSQQQPQPQGRWPHFTPDGWNDQMSMPMVPPNRCPNSLGLPAPAEPIPYRSNTSKEPRLTLLELQMKEPNSFRSSISSSSNYQMAMKPPPPPPPSSSSSSSSSLLQKKVEMSPVNELAGTSIGSSSGIKRPSESIGFKQEDDSGREIKMRRVDVPSNVGYQQSGDGKSMVVNGIETNPDLVSSLLKESLRTRNPMLNHDPAVLANVSLTHSQRSDAGDASSQKNGGAQPMEIDALAGESSSKSEKKKKKEKHKHKEKDKSKDREEKKKHKKDKDKHKDRERETDDHEHVKITISKKEIKERQSATVASAASTSGESRELKIKIPKKIIGDLNSTSNKFGNPSVTSEIPPHSSGLKIKISKDKIEYNSAGTSHGSQLSSSLHSSGHYSSSFSASSSSSSHSKKKDRDRDRDRDKEKKRSSHDSSKSGSSSTSASTSSLHLSSVKSHNSSNK